MQNKNRVGKVQGRLNPSVFGNNGPTIPGRKQCINSNVTHLEVGVPFNHVLGQMVIRDENLVAVWTIEERTFVPTTSLADAREGKSLVVPDTFLADARESKGLAARKTSLVRFGLGSPWQRPGFQISARLLDFSV